MEVVGVLGKVRTLRLGGEACREPGLETDRGADGLEVSRGTAVEVDPQQLALADPLSQSRLELYLAVKAVGVVEADPKSAGRAGRGDQWRTASSSATRAATNAVPYWSTSIDRSTCWLAGGSITPAWGIRETL
jgi:hypothetical protein